MAQQLFRLRLFKLPSYSIFNYQPLYYDEQKERAEELKGQINAEQSGEHQSKIKGQFKRMYRNQKSIQKSQSFRVLLWMIVLGALAYFILFY